LEVPLHVGFRGRLAEDATVGVDKVYKFLFDLTDGKNWPARFHTAAVCSFS
jgi:hypothetical protein